MVRQIRPVYRTASTSGKSGGGTVGAGLLGAAGGLAGALVPGGGPMGAIAGASAGAGLGQMIGNAISPAIAGTQSTSALPQVAISAFDAAVENQKILDGLRAVQSQPLLAEYARPLAEGYVKSMIRLKQMG